jgi:uncharacterized protein YfaT (DUF1175 family)
MTRPAMIAIIAVVSCQRSPKIPDTCAEADKLRWVEHANLQEDFRQRVEREHDMRFLSVFGLSFATEFPGLQDTPEMQRLVQEHGSRRVEGTTDIISCIEQHQLLDQVFQYATRYNSMILGYRECPK